MKRIRLFTALAAFGLVASMLSLAATGPAAARTVTIRPASVRAVRPDFTEFCSSHLYGTFNVNADGIHIKNSPDGTNVDSISKTALFDSGADDTFSEPFCYSSEVAGQNWVLGFANAHPGHYGWVGCEYLSGCTSMIEDALGTVVRRIPLPHM
jgi:hypothetical protein